MPSYGCHINFIDNTYVPKLPREIYEISIDGDPYSSCFENSDVPFREKSLDEIFEQKMQKRLSSFHALPIDRTQYEKELLDK